MFQYKRLSSIATVASALVLSSTASAQQTVHPSGDIFNVKPAAASAEGKPACAPAKKYVDTINAGRYQDLHALFADDAVFLTPIGKVLHGPVEIGDFYQDFLGKARPNIVAISYIADGPECVMELAAITRLDDSDPSKDRYQLSAIDHFTVNKEGKIAHMVVFLRPKSLVTQSKAQ